MNRKIYLFPALLLLIVFQTGFAQEVAQIQKTLITKRTATWCPYCGTWGWDFFESVDGAVGEKAVLVAAHFGGSSLENPTSLDWVTNLGSSSQPKFFINNDLLTVNSSNMPDALNVLKGQVDNNYLQAPVANVGLQTGWSGPDLSIQTRTQFFQDANGEYYLGIYLVEDEVLATQAGQTGQVSHHHILRGDATPNTFGELILNGAVSAGETFTKSFTTAIGSYKIDDLDIVGVIWKKENNKYLVVNVWSIDAKPVISSTETLAVEAGILASIRPNLVTGGERSILFLQLEQAGDLDIRLVNPLGEVLGMISKGFLEAGTHSLPIETAGLAPGMYSVQILASDGWSRTLKMIRQ